MRPLTLSKALYRHPAFWPHAALKKVGVKKFWLQNLIVGVLFISGLTWCAWWDGALILKERGYGYLEHPGIFGWYAIQLLMPVSIFGLLVRVANTRHNWNILSTGLAADCYSKIIIKTKMFVGLETQESKNIYRVLFTIGISGFAWNTFQNLFPGKLAPLDFWDSISFQAGYIGTRINKFYMHALLLPSLLHIFWGIVDTQLKYLRSKSLLGQLRISPFNPDHCGGLGFLPDLILSPTIIAIGLSGGAYYGVIYTHKTIDISTAMGSLVVAFVFAVFYLWPTVVLRYSVISLRKKENQIIHSQQRHYYNLMLERALSGDELEEALNYIKYFDAARKKIEEIPLWPHFSRILGTVSLSVVLPIVVPIVNLCVSLAKVFLNQN